MVVHTSLVDALLRFLLFGFWWASASPSLGRGRLRAFGDGSFVGLCDSCSKLLPHMQLDKGAMT